MHKIVRSSALLLCLTSAPLLLAAGPTSSINACQLLPEKVIVAVQGSQPTAVQPTVHDDGKLTVNQCFFTLKPFSHSVSVQVLSRSAADQLDMRQFWSERFHSPKNDEEEGKDRESPPELVRGVGEEAYWVKTGRGAALYALQDGYLVRVSIGGNAANAKDKTASLTRAVLSRLK